MIPTLDLANSLLGNAASAETVSTWNPADKTTNMSLSNSDKTAAANTNNYESVRTTRNNLNTSTAVKYYFEVEIDASVNGDIWLGFIAAAASITSGVFLDGSANYAVYRNNGDFLVNGGSWVNNGGSGTSYTTGHVIGVAIDTGAKKVWLARNNTWLNSGDPGAGTGECFNTMPTAQNTAFLFATDNFIGNDQVTLVPNAADLTYSAPSGFTAGLPAS